MGGREEGGVDSELEMSRQAGVLPLTLERARNLDHVSDTSAASETGVSLSQLCLSSHSRSLSSSVCTTSFKMQPTVAFNKEFQPDHREPCATASGPNKVSADKRNIQPEERYIDGHRPLALTY